MITKTGKNEWESEEIPTSGLTLQFVHQACRRGSSEGIPATARFFTSTDRDAGKTKVVFVNLMSLDEALEGMVDSR